jgi:hypothetical protein
VRQCDSDMADRRMDAPTLLSRMGQASREIVKDHTPRKAAEAIYRACELARVHRRKDVGHSVTP